jgi:chaperonin GroEL (HSP60 family)
LKVVTTPLRNPRFSLLKIGWRLASAVAREALIKSTKNNGADPEKFRNDLYKIACTTLSSKLLKAEKDYFANLAVDAIMRLKVLKLNLKDFLILAGKWELGGYSHHQEGWRVSS